MLVCVGADLGMKWPFWVARALEHHTPEGRKSPFVKIISWTWLLPCLILKTTRTWVWSIFVSGDIEPRGPGMHPFIRYTCIHCLPCANVYQIEWDQPLLWRSHWSHGRDTQRVVLLRHRGQRPCYFPWKPGKSSLRGGHWAKCPAMIRQFRSRGGG